MAIRRGLWIAALLAASVGAAAAGVHASSAASTRGAALASTTIDATYSCPVRSQRYADVYGSPTLPPQQGQARPGGIFLTTGVRTVTKNGATTTVAQVSFQAKRNSLRIDQKSCRRVTKRVPLKPTGLPSPPETATPTFRGYINQRCTTAARVVFHLRVTLTNGTPTHALFAVRNDNAKSRPLVFYKWSPSKLAAYTGNSCVDVN